LASRQAKSTRLQGFLSFENVGVIKFCDPVLHWG